MQRCTCQERSARTPPSSPARPGKQPMLAQVAAASQTALSIRAIQVKASGDRTGSA